MYPLIAVILNFAFLRVTLPSPLHNRYLPQEDQAVTELHVVVAKVLPALPALLSALQNYHLHSADGWITTAG